MRLKAGMFKTQMFTVRRLFWSLSLLLAVALGSALGVQRCSAQDPLPTVVQLPTFQFFSFSGTVVVPDGGATYLGGNKTAAIGSAHRGANRSFGQSLGNSQAVVHAQIIDLNQMDRQLLGGTPEEFLRRTQREAALEQPADPDAEGKALVRYARNLYRQGDRTGAFDTYRMAIGVLQSPRLRELAKVEFRRVFGTAADQSLRMASLRR